MYFDKLKSVLVETDYKLKNYINKLINRIYFKKLNDFSKIRKLLIFRTGSIGDSLCAIPAIENIRNNFPNAVIEVLTNTGAKNLVSLDKLIKPGIVDSFINYFGMSKKQLFKQLRSADYDLFIELTQVDTPLSRSFRNQTVVKFLKIPHAIGWEICVTYFFKKFQERTKVFPNEALRLLKILANAGLKTQFSGYSIGLNSEHETLAKDFFEKIDKTDKQRNIGIAFGAKLPRNRYPIEYYVEIARFLSSQNYNVFLFGGPEDNEQIDKFEGITNLENLCGKFNALESMALMKNCKFMITNDSGPLHMAYAVNTNVVAIFSCREYIGKWFPPENGKNKVIRSKNISCSICVWNKCKSNICLQQIKPEYVINEIHSLLKK